MSSPATGSGGRLQDIDPLPPALPPSARVREDDLTQASDAQLVVAIGRWRQDALAEAYRRHGGAVFALACRVLTDRLLAEEVAQDVFVRLWHEPGRFDPQRGSLRSFLLAHAHNRAVDIVRSEEARRGRERRQHQERVRVSAGEDVEGDVWDLTVAEHVRDALGLLPPGERQAIEMAYFGGKTYRQVAASLGEPEGTVKSRIRSGLRRLRDNLADLVWEDSREP